MSIRGNPTVSINATTGVEIGLCHQLSSRIVLDVVVGTEFYDLNNRAAVTGLVGLSVRF